MAKVIVLTNSSTNEFITVLNPNTDLIQWCTNWIENDDKDIEFWEGGDVSFSPMTENEICISGDNGLIYITITEFII